MNLGLSVSIIIPSRNVDYLLVNCIEKIRALYPDVKIVLILDEILPDDYKKFDTNVHLLKSQKYTMSAKRNQGVDFVDTKYIALIDSDAFPDENWLETSIDFLENHNDYSAVTGCQMNYPNDSFTQKCLRLLRFSPLFSHQEWFKIINLNTKETDCSEFMTSNVVITRETYKKLNGMCEDFYLAEDNEFSQRMFENGYKIRFIPNVRVFHREAKTYSFLRKFFAISNYYAKCFANGIKIKNNAQTLSQFMPFAAICFYLLLVILQFTVLKSQFLANLLLILPIASLLLLIYNAVIITKKLENKRLHGIIYLFFVSILFCIVWVWGTFTGLCFKGFYDVKNGYKHY